MIEKVQDVLKAYGVPANLVDRASSIDPGSVYRDEEVEVEWGLNPTWRIMWSPCPLISLTVFIILFVGKEYDFQGYSISLSVRQFPALQEMPRQSLSGWKSVVNVGDGTQFHMHSRSVETIWTDFFLEVPV